MHLCENILQHEATSEEELVNLWDFTINRKHHGVEKSVSTVLSDYLPWVVSLNIVLLKVKSHSFLVLLTLYIQFINTDHIGYNS